MIRGIVPVLTILAVSIACDSVRTIYQSSETKKNSWTVNAYTMSHCGCTQLFVEKYRNGKPEFQIMYTDNFARKNIYKFNEKGAISDTIVLKAMAENFDIPFDSLDIEIFRKIETIVNSREGLVYEIKWTEYKGFIKED